MIWCLQLCFSPEAWWQWTASLLSWAVDPGTGVPPACCLAWGFLGTLLLLESLRHLLLVYSQTPQEESEGESLLKARSEKSFISLFPVCRSILLCTVQSLSKSYFAWDMPPGHMCGLSLGSWGLPGARTVLGRALLSLHLLKHLWK